jgi:hypothetical protein
VVAEGLRQEHARRYDRNRPDEHSGRVCLRRNTIKPATIKENGNGHKFTTDMTVKVIAFSPAAAALTSR